jgi:phage regulator Rha-like protein
MQLISAMCSTELVKEINGEARTSTEIIAEGAEIAHKDVLALTRKYLILIRDFGRVTFETRPFKTRGGVQRKEIAWLNERQATFLITLMRNTEKVVALKFALVKRFFEMSEKLTQLAKIAMRRDLLLQIEARSRECSRTFGIGLALRRKEKRSINNELTQLYIQLQLFPN